MLGHSALGEQPLGAFQSTITRLSASHATYTLVGQTSLPTVFGGRATFSLSGQDAALTASRELGAGHATFTLTGYAATGGTSVNLAADHGAFVLTGQAAGLVRGSRKLLIGQGSFVLAGYPSTLNKTLVGPNASILFTGHDAALWTARLVAGEVGSYTLAGQAAGSLSGVVFSAAHGEIGATGQDVDLLVRYRRVRLSKSYVSTAVRAY